jgi:hypothetical protein
MSDPLNSSEIWSKAGELTSLSGQLHEMATAIKDDRSVADHLGEGDHVEALRSEIDRLGTCMRDTGFAVARGSTILRELGAELDDLRARAVTLWQEIDELEYLLTWQCSEEDDQRRDRQTSLINKVEDLREDARAARLRARNDFYDARSDSRTMAPYHKPSTWSSLGSAIGQVGSTFWDVGSDMVSEAAKFPGWFYDRYLLPPWSDRRDEAWDDTYESFSDFVGLVQENPDFIIDAVRDDPNRMGVEAIIALATLGIGGAARGGRLGTLAQRATGFIDTVTPNKSWIRVTRHADMVSDPRVRSSILDITKAGGEYTLTSPQLWALNHLGIDGRGKIAEIFALKTRSVDQGWSEGWSGGMTSTNYPTVDDVNRWTGEVVSVKSMDLTATTYDITTTKGQSAFRRKLETDLASLSRFDGRGQHGFDDAVDVVSHRAFELVVPSGSLTAEHLRIIDEVLSHIPDTRIDEFSLVEI